MAMETQADAPDCGDSAAATDGQDPEAEVPPGVLAEVSQWRRSSCSRCGQSAMFYCPFCCTAMGVPDGTTLPQVALPFRRCEVIFDDAAKKATSIHAKVLAPSKVRLIDLFTSDAANNRTLCRRGAEATGDGSGGKEASDDCEETAVVREIPEFDARTTAVLFPDEGSLTFEEARGKDLLCPAEELTILVIDSPWRKAQILRKHPRIAPLQSLRLQRPPESHFWRYHSEGAGCVSTIEALTAFTRELRSPSSSSEELVLSGPKFLADPLLFFFVRQFAHIVSVKLRAKTAKGADLPMQATAKERRAAVRRQTDKPKAKRMKPMGQVDGGDAACTLPVAAAAAATSEAVVAAS
eukprot:TRINITY_DN102917_c0_g1_i1.p1 TRINITY_DN102917_c0_g1~~TRINITY_DN102917_c0_g1_i1.p1  ORF type:complete len:368 (-),score=89.29 TRINITY_DN102917_c0_g1_i1:104-1159(-)